MKASAGFPKPARTDLDWFVEIRFLGPRHTGIDNVARECSWMPGRLEAVKNPPLALSLLSVVLVC